LEDREGAAGACPCAKEGDGALAVAGALPLPGPAGGPLAAGAVRAAGFVGIFAVAEMSDPIRGVLIAVSLAWASFLPREAA
jgi:hypothetical protein